MMLLKSIPSEDLATLLKDAEGFNDGSEWWLEKTTNLNFDFWTKNLDDMKDPVIDNHVFLTGNIDKSSKAFAKDIENTIPHEVGQNHAEINVVMASDLAHIVPQVEQIDQTMYQDCIGSVHAIEGCKEQGVDEAEFIYVVKGCDAWPNQCSSGLSRAKMAGVLPHDAGKEVERSHQFDVLIVEYSMFVSRVHSASGISCNNEEVGRDELQRVSKEDSYISSLKLARTRCRNIEIRVNWLNHAQIGQSVSKVKPVNTEEREVCGECRAGDISGESLVDVVVDFDSQIILEKGGCTVNGG
ncbi:hypothetical protein VNO78_07586 [Psophocarpus tetragonolobus]|uniref:Uncharacterized protein n=1 Tax=Psophocarpus tetragonolobus TaxID=3891 RepID=A0AAN9SWG3_PSOTE